MGLREKTIDDMRNKLGEAIVEKEKHIHEILRLEAFIIAINEKLKKYGESKKTP